MLTFCQLVYARRLYCEGSHSIKWMRQLVYARRLYCEGSHSMKWMRQELPQKGSEAFVLCVDPKHRALRSMLWMPELTP
jgi:hypothetical protein